MKKILLVEDDALFLESIEEFLSLSDFKVSTASSVEEALEHVYNKSFDLYLFDIKLDDENGIELLRTLKQSGDATPTIFLTSYQDTQTLSQAFASGCEDYLKKPFELDELLVRIHAVFSRYEPKEHLVRINEQAQFDTTYHQILMNQQRISLKPMESKLLQLLLQERPNVLTKEILQDALWDGAKSVSEGSVRVYINNLKKILGKESIQNLRGIGYKLV